ncbi:MAG: hypothetical protein ACOYJQ_13455 [Pseudochelatococcus sp.]|jgi:hypothetical protein
MIEIAASPVILSRDFSDIVHAMAKAPGAVAQMAASLTNQPTR